MVDPKGTVKVLECVDLVQHVHGVAKYDDKYGKSIHAKLENTFTKVFKKRFSGSPLADVKFKGVCKILI